MRVPEEHDVAPRRPGRGNEPALARLGTEAVPVGQEQTMPLALQNPLLRGGIEKPEAVTVAAHGINRYAVLLLKPRKIGEPVAEEADKIRVTVHRKHAAEPRRIPVRIRKNDNFQVNTSHKPTRPHIYLEYEQKGRHPMKLDKKLIAALMTLPDDRLWETARAIAASKNIHLSEAPPPKETMDALRAAFADCEKMDVLAAAKILSAYREKGKKHGRQ